MINDKKFVEKLDKLLKAYGVKDEETRKVFIDDLKESIDENDVDGDKDVDNVDVVSLDGDQPEKVENDESNELPKVEDEEKGEPEKVEPATDEIPAEQENVPFNAGEKDPNEIDPKDIVPETETPAPELPKEQELPSQPNQAQDYELTNKVEEQAKTIDGLLARIDALEQALKDSGVLTEAKNEKGVGVDESKTPANDPYDDPLTSVLAQINGRR